MPAFCKILLLGEIDPRLSDKLIGLGIQISKHNFENRGGKISRYISGRLASQIQCSIIEENPDLIVFHDERDRATLLSILRANRKSRKPVIWFRGAVGGYNAFSPIDRYLLRNRQLYRLIVRSYAMINYWAGSRLISSLTPSNRIECSHHYFDFKPATKSEVAGKREQLGILPEDIVIGTVANYRSIKNLEFAAKVVSGLADRNRIKFLVIGSHNGEFRAKLECLMPGDIIAPGIVAEAGRFAGIFDIFVSTTRRPGEGFGLAIGEAMACGVPVVATHTGGATDLVENGVSGYLLPENLISWHNVLQKLVKDPGLRKKLGEAGQRKIKRQFSLEAAASNLARIFADVISEARPSG